MRTDHKAPRYAVFSIPLLRRPSLRPKYPPQHPILENPQPTFLPQCERPLKYELTLPLGDCYMQ